MKTASHRKHESRSSEWTPERLARVARSLEGAPVEEVLQWAVDNFSPDLCLATSFGPQSIVLMHQVSKICPETLVFYLDTELLFPETYALRDELSRRFGLQFKRLTPEHTVEQQAERHGPRLWARSPDQCCRLRKVLPLRRFLADKRAWITGVRNGQSTLRAQAPRIEWDAANAVVKLNPIVRWTGSQVWDYIQENDLPCNPLHEKGFSSIGCQPCTRAVLPGEDLRAGRWPGFAKSECGIHSGSRVVQIGSGAEKSVR